MTTELLYEAFDLLSSTTILGVLYGIAFTLYCHCARLLYLQLSDPGRRKQARFSLAYISLILICGTAYLALVARFMQLAYIDHANDPGGPRGFKVSYNSTTEIYGAAIGIFDLAVEVLTMAIQIWRLWVVWGATRYPVAVIILPVLLLSSYIAMDVPSDIASAFPQFAMSVQAYAVLDVMMYVVSSGFTVLVTGLVSARILLVRRRHVKILGNSDASVRYTNIVAMLVESYALESAWSIGAAISGAVDSPAVYLFMMNDSTIKIIANFLVVYRVAAGRGWTSQTERELTSLQWNRDTRIATSEGQIKSRVPEIPALVAGDHQLRARSEYIV